MAAIQPWDYIAKIVSLGDSGSGKSSVRFLLLSLYPPLTHADETPS